jgi:hypothetical protein
MIYLYQIYHIVLWLSTFDFVLLLNILRQRVGGTYFLRLAIAFRSGYLLSSRVNSTTKSMSLVMGGMV